MPRRVITEGDAKLLHGKYQEEETKLPMPDGVQTNEFAATLRGRTRGVQKDDYASRVLKLVPAEIVAAFITVDNVVRSAQGKVSTRMYWLVFVTIIILCFFYSRRLTVFKPLPPSNKQAFVCTLSFVVWAFAIGGPFARLPWYETIYGALLLPLYTLGIPLVMD